MGRKYSRGEDADAQGHSKHQFPVLCPFCGIMKGWSHQQWCDRNPDHRTKMFEPRDRPKRPPPDSAEATPDKGRGAWPWVALGAIVLLWLVWTLWKGDESEEDSPSES